jgi:hypothetical protein
MYKLDFEAMVLVDVERGPDTSDRWVGAFDSVFEWLKTSSGRISKDGDFSFDVVGFHISDANDFFVSIGVFAPHNWMAGFFSHFKLDLWIVGCNAFEVPSQEVSHAL